MSEAAWIGYTPITRDVINHMKNLWARYELPEEPDFSHWSIEYARQVYELVVDFVEVGRVPLLQALATCEVWDEDPVLHQWTPAGWTG